MAACHAVPCGAFSPGGSGRNCLGSGKARMHLAAIRAECQGQTLGGAAPQGASSLLEVSSGPNLVTQGACVGSSRHLPICFPPCRSQRHTGWVLALPFSSSVT